MIVSEFETIEIIDTKKENNLPIGMGLRKEDNELREALNKAFAEMRADGTYEKLAKKNE